jgi:hypothetical protein
LRTEMAQATRKMQTEAFWKVNNKGETLWPGIG